MTKGDRSQGLPTVIIYRARAQTDAQGACHSVIRELVLTDQINFIYFLLQYIS